MLVATSLMYSEDEYEIQKQTKAMQTWKDAGFDVISCNVKEEIDNLKVVFPQVVFVELSRSGKEKTGKPFPYIYDMLQVLNDNIQSKNEICGIVNSDIFIKNLQVNVMEEYFNTYESTVFILHRYDVEDESDVKGEYYFSGIDVFFFLNNFLKIFPDRGFMLGRPEWDHWFLYEAMNAGMEVREIKNKIAFHIKHKQRWTPSDSNKMITNQPKKADTVCMDEEYYYRTNELMSDLSCRIMLKEDLLSKRETVINRDGYYYDVDREELLEWEKEKFQTSDIAETVGIMYFKNQKPYRVCASHRKIIAKNDGTFSLGEVFPNERDKGNILKYVDFKDLDFVKDLNRVYLYPAGRASRLLLDCLDTYQIPVLGMVDRDESLWGKKYKGKEIFDLSVLEDTDFYDYVIIATNLYVKEIYESLSKIVPKEKLIIL